MTFEEASLHAHLLLDQMTLEEKLSYIGGDKNFFLKAIERLNIPPVYFSDATQGIHLREEFYDVDISQYQPEKSTSFPCAVLLSAAWNPDLTYKYAKAIGEECRTVNIGVLLGPGMNIYRISQCGRNFEYFGEDPFLTARHIEKYVEGLQSTGTVATLKHFVANNTDFFRRKSNSVIDERTLHEIYLPAFKAGIDAGAKAVMTAYNLVNGEWCGESKYLIHDILREHLDFQWMVMTDWWSVYDGEKVAKSGQDLEMPYTVALQNAKDLLREGKILEADIDQMVIRILSTCIAMELFDRKAQTSYYNTFPEHKAIALQTAREGIVLLKNSKNILPLNTDTKNILLCGSFIDEILHGGGAATVEGYDSITMLEAVKKEFGEEVTFLKDPSPEQIRSADIVLCNTGTFDSEGWDRPFELPETQENFVLRCVENNPNTIIIVTSGSGVRMTQWINKAAAIIYAWYLGQIGNVALAEILSGRTNPSAKLPITIEREFSDSPGFGYTSGEDLYLYWNDDEEKIHPVYDVEYKEGVFVGYRWYEYKKIKPLFPFGHGLSYTSFEYRNLTISKEIFTQTDIIDVFFFVKNTGNTAGAETAQLYVQDVKHSYPRPPKELKGFKKVLLNPGEEKEIHIKLTLDAFSFWNPEIKKWHAEPGEFRILVGSSSQDIYLEYMIKMRG